MAGPFTVGELAKRLGLELAWKDKEDYVRQSCEMTPGVKEAGGFEYMKKHGVWHDPDAEPNYGFYEAKVDVSGDGVILDEKTGVYWDWKKAGVASEEEAKAKGYLGTEGAKDAYVAQSIDGEALLAYPPKTKFMKSAHQRRLGRPSCFAVRPRQRNASSSTAAAPGT